ncbi:MAG: glycosyltransferase family 4 protein [Clostridia bacterium]|nr:glycosyltransferase family 4 protein [Clostridia bacterium]
MKRKILVWETLGIVSGGQKMTLAVMDMLADEYDFHCLIPTEGPLSEELKKRNISYTLLGDQTMPTGVKGKSVIFRYAWLSLKAVVKGLFAVIKEKPQTIYAPGPAALPWSAVVGLLTGKKVIWHLHHIFLDGATKKLLNLCSGFGCVKSIIAVSDCVGEQIQNEKGKLKTTTVYNPVDFERFSSGDGEKIKKELALTSKDVVIGHVALLQELKKQSFVLEVAKELKTLGKSVKVIFAGRARDEDKWYEEKLKNEVSELGLENAVVFLGHRTDIPDILKAVDVIMIPSAFEGFPLAGLEAASAGTPVVACDRAGAEEFIRVSLAGAVFKEDNVKDAVEKVLAVIADRNAFSENGKAFANTCDMKSYQDSIKGVFGG